MSIDSEEAPFSIDELFFSRTDKRGIIQAGNIIFQRISQYEWGELLMKPHNIIRHYDMPKAVFYLLWDFIKQGKPIGAYVKNRAKDGRYYWVFAIVTPIEDGYLSVRLKPSSEFFPIVNDAYKALLDYEKQNKVTPKESCEHLLGMLQNLGFGSYDEFMAIAIRKEIDSRSEKLGQIRDEFNERFEELTSRVNSVMKETTNILSSYESNKYVPMNLKIKSSRLGEEGKAISVISSNFSVVSAEIQNEISTFYESAKQMFNKIYEGQFLICTAKMQQEVADSFKNESSNGYDETQDNVAEMKKLEMQRKEYYERTISSLNQIKSNISNFSENCNTMKRCVTSLEVIRVMGKVDSSRISNKTMGLGELIDELGLFQQSLAKSISEIEKYNNFMLHDANHLLESI